MPPKAAQPDEFAKTLVQLTPEEGIAARGLGLVLEEWPDLQLHDLPVAVGRDWRMLSPEEKQHAHDLGYKGTKWDDQWDKKAARKKKAWDALSREQMDSAIRLGFAAHTWEDQFASSAVKLGVPWLLLEPEDQKDARVLGYRWQTWEEARAIRDTDVILARVSGCATLKPVRDLLREEFQDLFGEVSPPWAENAIVLLGPPGAEAKDRIKEKVARCGIYLKEFNILVCKDDWGYVQTLLMRLKKPHPRLQPDAEAPIDACRNLGQCLREEGLLRPSQPPGAGSATEAATETQQPARASSPASSRVSPPFSVANLPDRTPGCDMLESVAREAVREAVHVFQSASSSEYWRRRFWCA